MALIKSTHAANAVHEAIVLDLGDLRRQAERMRQRAKAEAEEILEQARQEAERLTAGAAEQGRAAGFTTGHAEGLEAGREQGRAQSLQQTHEALEQLQSAWIGAAQQWDAERRQMLLEARQSLLALAVSMAQKIVRRVPVIDPALIVDQVAEAIEHVARPCDVAIRIHPDDRTLVEQALPQLLDGLAQVEHAALLDDPAIERGGCIVTYGQGRIDATLNTQLDRLIETMLPDPGILTNQKSKIEDQKSS